MSGPERRLTRQATGYHVFMLRVWYEPGEGVGWRASLQEVSSRERVGFPDLSALCEFLRRLTEFG